MKLNLYETGIRNINELAKNYDKSIIYGHMDLDGLASSICAKAYLERYGIKTVDFQVIQYGATEFAITKPTDPKTMAVLVDFAHGKPFMKIHTDHHQNQQVMKGSSNQFRHSESNADTWSTSISTYDIFPPEDIRVINMIDSAQYKREGIHQNDMLKATISVDKEKSVLRNHIDMGMACGKLVLAFKNRPGFFKEVVMRANPSLESMYNTIRNIVKEKIADGEKGYITPEKIESNSKDYWDKQSDKKIPDGTLADIDTMTNGQSIIINDIIFQLGGGNMSKVGGYDRYTAYRLYPDAKYFIMLWNSFGMMQVSKNPWYEGEDIKDVDLGDLILNKVFKERVAPTLRSEKYRISLLAIKRVNEEKVDEEKGSIGFDYDGLLVVYPSLENVLNNYSNKFKYCVKKYMNWKSSDFENNDPEEVQKALDILHKIYIPLSEIVLANSGGHKSITNLTGFGYLNEELRLRKKLDNGKNPYIKSDDKVKYKKSNYDKADNLSTVILKSTAKDIIKYLSGEELGKVERKRVKKPKTESISNERLANREAIKYVRTLDKTILENLNKELEEDFYISLSEKYKNYDYRRNIFPKERLFKSLNESLKNENVSNSLKDFIKNILI